MNSKPLTPSEMGKKRWAGVSKEDRRAYSLRLNQAKEAARCQGCHHLHMYDDHCGFPKIVNKVITPCPCKAD